MLSIGGKGGMFDAVLYAVKIVKSLLVFTSYSANIYNEVRWALNVYFVSNSLGYVSAKNWQN